MLPRADSLSACGAAGVPASHVIAMQGPFSRELNEALIRQFRIAYLVTKDGGGQQAPGPGVKPGVPAVHHRAAAALGQDGVQHLLGLYGGDPAVRAPLGREDGLGYEDVLQQCREMMGCG